MSDAHQDHRGRPRVAVTGMGVKTPAGTDLDSSLRAIVACLLGFNAVLAEEIDLVHHQNPRLLPRSDLLEDGIGGRDRLQAKLLGLGAVHHVVVGQDVAVA